MSYPSAWTEKMTMLKPLSSVLYHSLRNFGAEYILDHLRSQLRDHTDLAALPESFRREIESARRQVFRPKHLPNPVELFGYTINFLGSDSFRFLANEIFFEPSYFFHSDTESPLIFDCGSNIGMSVLFFKKLYPKARIVAFEPDPFTFEVLSANISQNNLSNVQAHQGALGAYEGEIDLFRDASPETSSLLMSTLRKRHNGPALKVPAFKLSSFISSDIDLIKIDIEGAEGAVLRELAEADKLPFLRRIHLEYHHHIDRSTDELSSVLALMEDHQFGYQLRSTPKKWPSERDFQDISIYFYRK